MKWNSLVRRFLTAAVAVTGSFLTVAVGAAPSIQAIDVAPNPLVVGQNFTVSMTASSDVTQATATADFRPALPRLLRIPLTKQGTSWSGGGLIPTGLPVGVGAVATVQVFAFDAGRHLAQAAETVGVAEPSIITANFAGGVLTVTGDDHDNTIVVGRDPAGTSRSMGATWG
jgi:hypothetical protein